ncbi:MAG TPA: hypothetical protein VIY56_09770 [Vicinamibacterales bacterium]
MADRPALEPSDVQGIDAQASVLMKRGIALMAEERAGAPSEALACFDEALDLRGRLPLEESSVLRYGLAACWLNRADALMRLGGGPQIAEAVRSCDAAIAQLRRLPLGDDPRFSRRLAMAHHNRGMFLLAQGGPRAEVVGEFQASIAVLEHDHAAPIDDRRHLLAVAWMNLAGVHASEDTEESASAARFAAARAAGLVEAWECDDPAAAEVGLNARHALCRTYAGRLASLGPGVETMPEDVHEATDAVDDGLALVRRWEQKGVTRFRRIAADLFRFGARVYLLYQPQFLEEFMNENLDPARSSTGFVEDPELQAVVQDVVDLHARLHG